MKHATTSAAIAGIFFLIPVYLFSDNYPVTNTHDSGAGSLRQAIIDANSRPGPDIILFQIPEGDPGYNTASGVLTIKPLTQLPKIEDDELVIDGGSQKQFLGMDTNPDGPELEICGIASSDYSRGLYVHADRVEIIGLIINDFRNLGWTDAVFFEAVKGGLVSRCYIGTDATGMKRRDNFYGIYLDKESEGVEVRENIVSANRWGGIRVAYGSRKNTFFQNTVGLNRDRSDTLGNGTGGGNYGGVFVDTGSDSNIFVDNWIGGNKGSGISLWESSGNQIQHNCIGTDTTLQKSFGNSGSGIYIAVNPNNPHPPEYNRIQDNWISRNGYGGVYLAGPDIRFNTIRQNRISSNSVGGIASDQPLVQGVERPVIEEFNGTAVSMTAGAGQTVDLFNDENNEGRIYLGTGVADGSGHFSLVLPGPTPLSFITATATGLDGSTSGFSQPFAATSPVQAMTARPAMDYLSANYPNPFNPSTILRFGVSRPGPVRITVWNEKGERAAILTDGRFEPGEYQAVFEASGLSAGIYVVRFETNDFFEARKIILVQ